MVPVAIKHPAALASALALSLGLAACGSTVSTTNFKGESHNVAQAIANLQSDATTGSQSKICDNDLASSVLAKLKANGSTCQQALKDQLNQIDNFDVTVQSITVNGTTATAKVKSTYLGKSRAGTLQLIKEGKTWKVASLG